VNNKPFQLCTRFAVVIGLCSFTIAAELRGDPGTEMEMGTRTACTWETIDYSLTNTTWSENPFDLVATVTFVHAKETRTTEMFYVGDNTWKFRFTGTRTGLWNFSTASPDSDLDGTTGSVTVTPRPHVGMKGFLTHVGNKNAIPTTDGSAGHNMWPTLTGSTRWAVAA